VLRSRGRLGKALEWKILQLAETLYELISRPPDMTANSPAFDGPVGIARDRKHFLPIGRVWVN
jgi:hypothetical protein